MESQVKRILISLAWLSGAGFAQVPALKYVRIWYRMSKFTLSIALALAGSLLPAAENLRIYSIDVEGGQSTLIVSPAGESMLIDTGWSRANDRDADRIVATAKAAGVKQIDYLVITHYHVDHVGGVPALAARIPIRNFIDHGDFKEDTPQIKNLYQAYVDTAAKGNRIQVKPGQKLPIKSLDVTVISAAGEVLKSALPGAGQPNASCSSAEPQPVDTTENVQSVGMLLQFGSFRFIDMGDLTWNKELELVCPNNKIGTVDLLMVSHHGWNLSSSPQFIAALHPRVAIMNNGARKGGTPSTWQIIHDNPGLLDFWQLHFSIEGGKEHNVADNLIANPDEKCEGKGIDVTASKDGSFTVVNSRNQFQKTYGKK
jgi:competence protein ComEC